MPEIPLKERYFVAVQVAISEMRSWLLERGGVDIGDGKVDQMVIDDIGKEQCMTFYFVSDAWDQGHPPEGFPPNDVIVSEADNGH